MNLCRKDVISMLLEIYFSNAKPNNDHNNCNEHLLFYGQVTSISYKNFLLAVSK